MIRKIIFAVLVMSALCLAAATWVYNPVQSSQEPRLVTVDVRQLPIDTNTNAPVAEILNPLAQSTAKNRIDQFSCYVKNNTRKKITALTLALTTTLEETGKETSDINLLTTDTVVHPDIKEELGLKDIEPGSNHQMQLPGAITFDEGATVKSLSIEIRCVLFDDDSSFGYDPKGEALARIRLTREGASRYKAWLIKENRKQLSLQNAFLQEIKSQTLPEAELPSRYLKEGADMYRRWLLRVSDSKGVGAATAYLNN